jgi:Uma2 family endonuclease
MPPAGEHHGYYAEITGILRDYVKRHKLGRVYVADTGFRLRSDTVRARDVAFVKPSEFSRSAAEA